MSPARIAALVDKEFHQIMRDWRTLGIIIFVPAFLLVMYGYAIDLDVKNMPVAVYDQDGSVQSRALMDRLFEGGTSPFFHFIGQIDRPEQIDSLLLSERAQAVLVIPPDFSRRLLRQEDVSVQLIVDGVNASRAATAMGYLENIIQSYGLEQVRLRVPLPVDFRVRVWYNPELKSNRFLIPGLIALILMVVTVIVTSLSIVRERELGSMEQLMVSPLRPGELILGKLIPYAVISLLSTIFILGASAVLFGVTVRGSMGWLFLTVLLFLIGALGTGLLISTAAASQEVAFMISSVSSMLPTFILSGFVFPISNMPVPIQIVTYFVPARYFLVALRDLLLKGAGIEAFWQDLLMLAGYAFLMLSVGTLRLRKMLG